MRASISAPACTSLLVSFDSEVVGLLNAENVQVTRRGRALFVTRSSIDATSTPALIGSRRGATDFPFSLSKAVSKLGVTIPYGFHLTEVPVALTTEGGGGIQINLPSNIDCPKGEERPWHAGLEAKGALATIRSMMSELVVAGVVSGYRFDENGDLRGTVSQDV